jgi:predicted membrane protein
MRNMKSTAPDAGLERSALVGWTIRIVSFLVALAISIALMLFPFLLRKLPGNRLHATLPIILLGVAGAFACGIGYTPDHTLLRMLFGPICAWLMIMGGMFLLFARWVFTIRQRAKTASPPDSADRAGSRKPVSEKREYFKGRLETIGGFAPKLFKLGV